MKAEVFKKNREALFKHMEENSMALLFAGKAPKKTADEAYEFTPNRNFYYLTGIDEEDIILLLVKGKEDKEILFIKEPDLELEKWIGKSIRDNEAMEIGAFEEIQYTKDFENELHSFMFKEGVETVYLNLERDSYTQRTTLEEDFAKTLKTKYPDKVIKNIYNEIASIRMIKSKEEIKYIREAIDITIEGVELLMKNSKPGLKEYELEAYFDFNCKRRGVKDFAFKTIAAAGVNATILHYVDNNSEMKDGDLILFDLGAQCEYYNADITRTFPVSGKFTDRQKEVYEAVLRVNKKVIKELKPGVNFKDVNDKATEWIGEECVKLGLIADKEDVRKYYWHSIGHSLGLDTHDVGKRNVELRPGMVFTVEPGIYINEEGIGVRIEDDVLITEDGNEVLTKNMIKEVHEIEEFMK
ncbi:aminopeptidase P family protein [Clostridium sp. 'White wine YQ']|uniref:aminopeptidase P family protein n=1 Tax=Clostridium sp. 'White wine YQ' TaxID=3027474 RepID=UPI0023655FC6|nr:aminopeptidase P family protein [Clostridium sp. 'White wine YQ']MDD7795112.1 aminopeptidase P family protein [Clostridium sp. 'White wine YQ']